MAHIEGPRTQSWRDRLWLLMTVAGVLMLVCCGPCHAAVGRDVRKLSTRAS